MQISKISEGFVRQVYDTKLQQWVSQEFVTSGEVEYQLHQRRIPLSHEGWTQLVSGRDSEPYLPFDMVQP